jgi:hypothetical protein
MLKIAKITTSFKTSDYKYLKEFKFIVHDVYVEKNSLDAIIPYFKKNNVDFAVIDEKVKFRIAAIAKEYVEKYIDMTSTLDKKIKIKIALEFDKSVTDEKLFGIGYEKDGMTETGTKIRYLIRDELLMATGLDSYLSVNDDG